MEAANIKNRNNAIIYAYSTLGAVSIVLVRNPAGLRGEGSERVLPDSRGYSFRNHMLLRSPRWPGYLVVLAMSCRYAWVQPRDG